MSLKKLNLILSLKISPAVLLINHFQTTHFLERKRQELLKQDCTLAFTSEDGKFISLKMVKEQIKKKYTYELIVRAALCNLVEEMSYHVDLLKSGIKLFIMAPTSTSSIKPSLTK